MPPPAARIKADDDDIFGDAGTDYICELPKVQRSYAALLLIFAQQAMIAIGNCTSSSSSHVK